MEVNSQLEAVCDLSPVLNSIVQEFAGLVKQLWHFGTRNPQADFAQLEERARQLSKECFASALQTAAQLQRHSIEEGWLLGHNRCECGALTRYKGKQRRTIQTWVGQVTLERGYFYCGECGTGRYPLDEALGIPGRERHSDGVQQGVCLLGVQLPFERASHALEALGGVSVSPKEAQRITEERGLRLDDALTKEGQLLLLQGGAGSGAGSGVDGVWAVALDAGRVRYEDGWHEVKAGVVFWAQPTYEEGGEGEEGEEGEIGGAEIGGAVATRQSYVAEVGSMGEAGERLGAEAARREIGHEEKVVCLGDGAPSNWTQFDEHFPNRVEVLDWYHAMEHLWAAGNGIFGQGTPEAVRWVKQWEGSYGRGE